MVARYPVSVTAARKPQDAAKFQRYRARLRARGLKEVRLWVLDSDAPGVREDLARQAALLPGAPEELETLGFIAALAAGDLDDEDA